MVKAVATLNEFNSVIAEAKAANKLVVVDFTASKCPFLLTSLPATFYARNSIHVALCGHLVPITPL